MPDIWETAAPLARRRLKDEHRAYLTEGSGISEDVIDARGYYSPGRDSILKLIETGYLNKSVSKATDFLGIPVFRPDGKKHCEIFRLWGEKVPADMKYAWPSKTRNALDVHPGMQSLVLEPEFPLILTEGVKKADAILSAAIREGFDCLVVAANGCWGWRAKVNGGSVVVPDFQDIVLTGRRIWVVSDSDFRSNSGVRKGWSEATTYLGGKIGADSEKNLQHRSLLVIVPQPGIEKNGADDFLVAGGTLSSLLALGASPQYVLEDAGMEDRRPLLGTNGFDLISTALDEVPHLLAPVLPENGIVVVAGHSATFKTWHGLSLALDGAFGLPWLDHPELSIRATGFSTLYVNKEMGQAMLGSRLKKLASNPRYRNIPGGDDTLRQRLSTLLESEADFDLASESHRSRLEEYILLHEVDLVVLDSLSMCWSGDENSNSEVGVFYSQLRGVISRVHCTFVILHHTLKPGGSSKSNHIMFNVRGAGQIVQQADTAIVFTPLETEQQAPGVSEVVVSYAKTRTTKEPPSFVSAFKDHDGVYFDTSYVGLYREITAQSYVGSRRDPRKLTEWVGAMMLEMPALQHTASGIRAGQLISLLRTSWPAGTGEAPSESAIKRSITQMLEDSSLEVIDTNKRLGDLYKLPEIIDGDALQVPSTVPSGVTSPPLGKRRPYELVPGQSSTSKQTEQEPEDREEMPAEDD